MCVILAREWQRGLWSSDDGQGGLACCSPWGLKESDRAERLNNNLSSEPAGSGQGNPIGDPASFSEDKGPGVWAGGPCLAQSSSTTDVYGAPGQLRGLDASPPAWDQVPGGHPGQKGPAGGQERSRARRDGPPKPESQGTPGQAPLSVCAPVPPAP